MVSNCGIVVGFFAGLIARALHPGHDKAGFIDHPAGYWVRCWQPTVAVAGPIRREFGGRIYCLCDWCSDCSVYLQSGQQKA